MFPTSAEGTIALGKVLEADLPEFLAVLRQDMGQHAIITGVSEDGFSFRGPRSSSFRFRVPLLDQCQVTVTPGDQATLRYHLPMRNLIFTVTSISALVALFTLVDRQKSPEEIFLVPLLWLWLFGTTYGFLVPRIRPALQKAASRYFARNDKGRSVAS